MQMSPHERAEPECRRGNAVGQPGKAGVSGEVAPEDIIQAGRRAFLQQERIDVVALASELGIARATVYRWFGDRDRFTGLVLASLSMDTLEGVLDSLQSEGALRVADAWSQTLEAIFAHPGMKAFLTSNPTRALTILTGRGSAVHEAMVSRITELIEHHCPASATSTVSSVDLAYALVRLAEAFCYTDITTGRPSDIGRAHPLFVRLLEG